ncbi:hypothetical protein GCM10027403_28960 [Arthrobacter tecti]
MRIDLSYAAGTNGLLNFLREQCEVVFSDRAALTCLTHTAYHLAAAERLTNTGAFDHGKAGCLYRGEAFAALRALAPPANRRTVISQTAVHNP